MRGRGLCTRDTRLINQLHGRTRGGGGGGGGGGEVDGLERSHTCMQRLHLRVNNFVSRVHLPPQCILDWFSK